MSNHYVRETTAGKAIAAYVILSPTGEEVATVNLHHTQSRTIANVWQSDDAAKRSAEFAASLPTIPTDLRLKVKGPKTPDVFRFQVGIARGYGYDKATRCLAGLVIDGIPITDHCSRYGAPARPGSLYPRDFPLPAGYSFANYRSGDSTWSDGSPRHPDVEKGAEGYSDCYRDSGLKIFAALGYRVIQAI